MTMPRVFARVSMFLVVALAMAIFPRDVRAQLLDLSVSPTVVTFPNSDPDTVPVLTASLQVTYRVRQNTVNRPWTMTILANGHLVAGAATVDISNVSWVATPSPPFQSGVLSRTVAQPIASGVGNVASSTQGQITFRLTNSWDYDAGLYTQTIVLTLSAP
jgi:hypothetical protein